jgi:transporter family protein
MMHPIADWRPWAAGSAAFAAATALLAKAGVSNVNPNFATFVRILVITPTLFATLLATGQMQSPASVSMKSYLFLALSGLATGASWLCYFNALKIGPASRVASVDKMSVVLVALAGALLFGERPSPGALAGVALIAAGGVLVAIS